MNIGERIKYLREKEKFTQAELGNLIGVNKATVNRYEAGLIDIKRTVAIKLAKALQVSPAYIMGWTDEEICPAPEDTIELKQDEKMLVTDYRKLNLLGKEKAQEYITDLKKIEKYVLRD